MLVGTSVLVLVVSLRLPVNVVMSASSASTSSLSALSQRTGPMLSRRRHSAPAMRLRGAIARDGCVGGCSGLRNEHRRRKPKTQKQKHNRKQIQINK